MSRRPKLENQARQDQALAILTSEYPYPFPLSTGEIARKVWVVDLEREAHRPNYPDKQAGS